MREYRRFLMMYAYESKETVKFLGRIGDKMEGWFPRCSTLFPAILHFTIHTVFSSLSLQFLDSELNESKVNLQLKDQERLLRIWKVETMKLLLTF